MLLYMWVINMSEIKTGRGYVYSILNIQGYKKWSKNNNKGEEV